MVDVILTTYQGSILGPIARMLGQILEWLYLFMSKLGIENVGICMILFTFIVNLLMFPLVLKQQKFANYFNHFKRFINDIIFQYQYVRVKSIKIKKIRHLSKRCQWRHRLYIKNMG